MVGAQSFETSGDVTCYAYRIQQSGLSDHPAGRFLYHIKYGNHSIWGD